nr:hypothetical protein [Tanacetum cinerariifolium]
MSYDGKGPSLIVNHPKTKKELSREEMEEDLYERIMKLNEKRPIIETLKYSDKQKKIIESVLLDKLKLDGEFELEEEMVGKELIRGYRGIREKSDPGVFVLPIHSERKYNYRALVDTGDQVKPISRKLTTLDHSKVEPIGRLEIMNNMKGKMSTFCGFIHQQYDVVKVRSNHAENDIEDDEEYYLKRDETGKPFYGPNSLPILLKNTEWAQNYSGITAKEDGNGKWNVKIRVMDPYGNVFKQGHETMETTAGTHDDEAGSSRLQRTRVIEIVEEAMLGRFIESIEEMLEIKIVKMGGQEEIFTSEAWRHEELISKKLIKVRLGGHGYSLSLLEFAFCLGLYNCLEIHDEGFEVYFQGGLRNDDRFKANDCWKMITYGLCQRTNEYDKIKRNELWLMSMFENRNQQGLEKKMGVLTDEVLDGLSALIYCRYLDANTLRELIGPNGRLIVEDQTLGVTRVAMPETLRPTMQDLYDRMGRIEIHQGELERMSRR